MSGVPTLIVGGYLGAGKTTLINDFLRAPGGERATVLVNDFGAINVDADLIAAHEGDTIALTNGCACCAIGDDLISAAERAAEVRPDRIVIEASGAARPDRMATLLLGAAGVAPAVKLTVVNAAAAARIARDRFVADLFRAQIAAADVLSVNRGAPDTGWRKPTVERLSDCFALAAQMVVAEAQGADAAALFETEFVCFEKPLSETALKEWLQETLRRAERVKGVVDIDGVLTAVNATPETSEAGAPAPPRATPGLVVIRRKGSLRTGATGG